MKKLIVYALLGGFVLPSIGSTMDLKQAKFTQVVNNVEVISPDKVRHAAEANDIFKMPDILRTGPASRAELVASDDTITRVGANTVFSFDPSSRTIDLEQGSLLFHSTHGKGGGTIHTGSATASVLGTTIIVTTTPNGGFKVLVLEGQAEIRFLNGLHLNLKPGQMTFVLPGGGTSPVVVFRLDDETKGSLLVNGFNNPLPSWPQIQTEITRQLLLLLNNKVQDVDLVVGDNATPNSVQVRMDLLGGGHSPFDSDSSIIGVNKTANDPLPVNYPPLDPAHVENGPFTPPSMPSFTEGLTFLGIVNPITGGSPASGFVGRNIDIDTGLNTPIDLTSFASKPDFDIMAAQDLRIWQSVNFIPFGPEVFSPAVPGTISLFAGGQMLIAPDSTLEAATGTFGLVANSFGTLDTFDGTVDIPNTLENVSVYNEIGDVDILSLSDLTIQGMNWADTVFAGGSVDIQSDGTLNIGANITISQLDNGHNVAIDAVGDVTLTAGPVNSGDLNINDTEIIAGGSISMSTGIISGSGNINMQFSDIFAGDNGSGGQASSSGGDVNINAYNGNVYLNGNSVYAYAGTGTTAAGGDVNIYGSGTVDVEDTYIQAGNDVNIESLDSLTLGFDSSGEIDAIGSINLTSDNSDVYVDYNLYAGSDVNINGGGAVIVGLVNTSASGNVDVEDSTIKAGWDNIINPAAPSVTGGSVNINADNGNVTLNSDQVYAYSGTSTGSGDVNVFGSGTVDVANTYVQAGGDVDISGDGAVLLSSGNSIYAGFNTDVVGDVNVNSSSSTIDIEGTFISATGDVNIESLDSLTLGFNSGDTIEAGGSVNLTSDNADVNVYNYIIYADFGNVNINGDDSVFLSGNSIYAGFDADFACDVNVNSFSSTIDIEGTFISATGNVNIESLDSLTLGFDSSDEIDANGSINLTSDTSNVYVDYDLYAGGDVNINGGGTVILGLVGTIAGGNVDVEFSTVEAGDSEFASTGGNVNINANNGNVTLNGDQIYAYSGTSTGSGFVNVNATSDVTVEDTGIAAVGGDVNITAGANLSIQESGTANTISGNNVTLSAGQGVSISGAVINANNGDLTINAGTAVSVSSLGKSDGHFAPADIGGGSVNITANNGNIANVGLVTLLPVINPADTIISQNSIDEESVTITDPGSIDLTAVTFVIVNNSTLTAQGGHVGITGESVNITGSSVSADAGYVDITSIGSTTDIEGTSIFATGDVNIESFDSLTLGLDSSFEIDANGSINLKSDNSNVFVDYDLFAGGDVNISSGGTVGLGAISTVTGGIDVENSTIEAGDSDFALTGGSVNIKSSNGDVNLFADDIEAFIGQIGTGDITITSSGTTDVEDTYINAGGNMSIDSSGTLFLGWNDTASANNQIIADGSISLISDNADVDIDNYSIDAYGGQLDITANNGSVDIENSILDAGNNSNVSISGNSPLSASGSVFITANGGNISILAGQNLILFNDTFNLGGNISISGSSITANGGDVDITANGSLSINNFGTVSDSGNTVTGDTIDITSSTITASGGVNIVNNNSIILPDFSGFDLSQVNNTDITGSTITANGGNVNINSGGTLTLGTVVTLAAASGNGDTINAGGSVDLTSGSSDVDIYTSAINAGVGGDLSISGQNTTTAGNFTISANGGTIDINAGNNLNMIGTSFDLNGDISISGCTFTAGSGDFDINTSGTFSISLNGVESIAGCSISGENIDISSSTITANNGNVNIVNNNSLTLPDPTAFDLSQANNIDITGSTITANAGSTANTGNINLVTDGGVDLATSTFNATGTGGTGGNITVNAGTGITVDGTALNADTGAGTIALNSTSGQTTIENGASAQAFYLNVNSPDGILIDGTSGGHLSVNTINLTAGMGDASGGPTITVQGEDLANATIMNVQAHTINLDNDNLSSSSSYNLTSFWHAFHINDGDLAGYVNFNNDTLDHAPITSSSPAGTVNPNNNGGIILGGTGAGIHID